MDTIQSMRREVKKYIDTADVKVVKMMHAMLEVDADNDWWDAMPDHIKANVEASIKEADKGNTTPHEEIQKRYKQWLAK